MGREKAEREKRAREEAERERREREKQFADNAKASGLDIGNRIYMEWNYDIVDVEVVGYENAEQIVCRYPNGNDYLCGSIEEVLKAWREATNKKETREQVAREKRVREQVAREQAERERKAREKAEREKRAREQAERIRRERQKADRERREREKQFADDAKANGLDIGNRIYMEWNYDIVVIEVVGYENAEQIVCEYPDGEDYLCGSIDKVLNDSQEAANKKETREQAAREQAERDRRERQKRAREQRAREQEERERRAREQRERDRKRRAREQAER